MVSVHLSIWLGTRDDEVVANSFVPGGLPEVERDMVGETRRCQLYAISCFLFLLMNT